MTFFYNKTAYEVVEHEHLFLQETEVMPTIQYIKLHTLELPIVEVKSCLTLLL